MMAYADLKGLVVREWDEHTLPDGSQDIGEWPVATTLDDWAWQELTVGSLE